MEDWGAKFGSVGVTGSELREDHSTWCRLPHVLAALDRLGHQGDPPEATGVSGSEQGAVQKPKDHLPHELASVSIQECQSRHGMCQEGVQGEGTLLGVNLGEGVATGAQNFSDS